MSFSKYSWPSTTRSSSNSSLEDFADRNTSYRMGSAASHAFESSSEDRALGWFKHSSSYRSSSTDTRGPSTPDIPGCSRPSLAQLALVAQLESLRLQNLSSGNHSVLSGNECDSKSQKVPLSGTESTDSHYSVSARTESAGHSTMGHLILVAEYERLRLKHVESDGSATGFPITFEEYFDKAVKVEDCSSDEEEDADTSCSATVYGDSDEEFGYDGDPENQEERWVSSDSGDADVSDDNYGDFD
ncbi:hypothetical protein BJ165DRAFT_1458810, partial [Panaeolus papilionaceus]